MSAAELLERKPAEIPFVAVPMWDEIEIEAEAERQEED